MGSWVHHLGFASAFTLISILQCVYSMMEEIYKLRMQNIWMESTGGGWIDVKGWGYMIELDIVTSHYNTF